VQAVVTQGNQLYGTGQAIATQAGTAIALITQAGPALGTAQALATQNPGAVETAMAYATQAGQAQAPSDIPIVARETTKNYYATDTIISYGTTLSFANVVEFYKKEMLANGWETASGAVEMDNTAMLNYVKPDRTANVVITYNAQDNTTLVLINIQPK
jgi:hypothetical protein